MKKSGSFLLCVAGFGALLCVAACPGPGPGTGDTDLAGGPDMSVTPDLSVDPLEAMVNAYATKYLACTSLPDPVPPDILDIYKRLFGDSLRRLTGAQGSGYTPDRMRSCAGSIEQLTCDALTASDGPPMGCQVTGTLSVGTACMDDSQCQSGYCRSGSPCGVCITPATAGQACSDASPCMRGLRCTAGFCTVGGDLGAACDGNRPCRAGLSCYGSVCKGRAKVGEACGGGTNPSCGLGLSCRNSICVSLLRAGSTCDPALPGQQCSQFHLCDTPTKRCTAGKVANLGEACDMAFACKEGYCGPDKRCVPQIQDGLACDKNGGGCKSFSSCRSNVCTPQMSCP